MDECVQSTRVNRPETQVLIVDDDPDQLAFLKCVLEQGGFNVTPSSGGGDALTTARARAFDLIVCDLVMPEMNGPELINRLRELEGNASTPMVLLTAGTSALSDKSCDLHSTPFRADAFCLKKDAPRCLVTQLRALLRDRRSERQLPAPAGLLKQGTTAKTT